MQVVISMILLMTMSVCIKFELDLAVCSFQAFGGVLHSFTLVY